MGEEPSGLPFNSPVFDTKNRPHNPMVNAGAIMVCTLLAHEGKTIEDFQNFYIRASSAQRADIDLPLYKEESLTGTTNHALRSLMLANLAYPQLENFEKTKKLADDGLDWHFIQCSMLVNVEGISRFGAMLANNGINPSTGERIIDPATVKATVTLMSTCGMYNGAGKFTKDHGIPTKSGISGGLLTVVPGLGAAGSYSPPLN
jgi:glutaminase